MLLANSRNGQKVQIVALQAEGAEMNQLASLGLVPGAVLRVIDNSLRRGSLVDCMGARLVLGRGLPQKIRVQ